MGKVGDRVREYIALIRLMQPMGRLRLSTLAGYGFIFIMMLGALAGKICIGFIVSSALVVLVVVAILVVYMINKVLK